MKIWFLLLLSSFLLAACGEGQIFEDPADRATREAGGTLFVQTAQAVEQQIPTMAALQATVYYAPILQTEQVRLQQQNANLIGTLNAVQASNPDLFRQPTATPPPAVTTNNSDPMTNTSMTDYMNITTANQIDGSRCAVNPNDTFYITGPNDPTVVYFSVTAMDVEAGTSYQARWNAGSNEKATSETWTADQDYDEICISFSLRSTDTPYEGGFWSAELRANGFIVAQTRFAMCTPDEFC